MDQEDVKEFLGKFKVTCKNCGSENVVIDADPGFAGSEYTGWCEGSLSAGCNDCKANDFSCAN